MGNKKCTYKPISPIPSSYIYDEEFENEIETRLSKLGEMYKKEFYRIRTSQKSDGVLSLQELDLLTLQAMERSFNRSNRKEETNAGLL